MSEGAPVDLETARRVVSEAERAALDKAEEFCAQAEALFQSVAGPTGGHDAAAREPFEAEMQTLRRQRDEAYERAAAAEGRLQRLRTEHEALLAQVGSAPAASGSAAGDSAATTGSAPAQAAEEERQQILAAARREAEELLASVRSRVAGEISDLRRAMSRAQEGL